MMEIERILDVIIKETVQDMKKKVFTIIVSEHNKKDLFNVLNERYKDAKWINVVEYSDYNDLEETDIYIVVGDIVGADENVKKPNGIVIDLSDSKILDMIDSNMDLSIVRTQLLDVITLFKETLIGIDYVDLKCVLQSGNNISVGIVESKSTSDMNGLIEKLITKTKVKVSECKSAYLYVDGDIGLVEINELAKVLEGLMREDSYIAFTASYDSSKVEEYYVMVLFAN